MTASTVRKIEVIDGHKLLKTVVYKELKNKKESITVNKVTSLNTMSPELLNRQVNIWN